MQNHHPNCVSTYAQEIAAQIFKDAQTLFDLGLALASEALSRQVGFGD
tara:strand:- start:166 stop:309 length:144 start_codon:yes stop_codon:yes gene_type:complete